MLFDLAYLLAALLGAPVLAWVLITRPRARAGMARRLGLARPDMSGTKPRVWVHGVSVGEVLAAQPLVRALREDLPQLEVVLSSTTGTGYEVARKTYPSHVVFYYPLDLTFAVRRVLDAVRPSMIVLVELEIWPTFLREAHRRGIPVVLVNGRITERSFRGYRRLGGLIRWVFGRVERFCVQSEAYRERFIRLGVAPEKLLVTGNLKHDAPSPAGADDPEGEGARVRADLGLAADVKVIVAGSTHPGEEAALWRAASALTERFPGLRLVVAPRHHERAAAVVGELERLGARAVRRTALGAGAAPAAAVSPDQALSPVVVGDTIGELCRFYTAADVVYVGGSLVPLGGQNMLEPCALGKPVVLGPHTANFRDTVTELRAADGIVEVADAGALERALERLLADPEAARAIGERGRAVIEAGRGAANRTVAVLREVLGAHGVLNEAAAAAKESLVGAPAPLQHDGLGAA